MTKVYKLITSTILATSLALTGTTIFAQDAPSHMLIEHIDTHPGKMDDYKAGWKHVLEAAKEHDYPFVTYVSRSGPRISMATPISSYADIDNMLEHRNRVYTEGGSKFEKAIAKMDGASYSTSSFVIKPLPEISNPPSDEQLADISMFEVSAINIQPGKEDKFEDIMARYKARVDSEGLADSVFFNIYRGGVGANGDYFFQSFGNDKMDLAEDDAALDKMMDNDEMKDLFGEFLSIARTGGYSDSTDWYMAKKLAYWPAAD